MTLVYSIYGNDGKGGDVDYSSPIATTSALSFISGSLTPSSDNRFAVRVFDPSTSLEEANTEARVRILIDMNGQDTSNLPNAPHALSTRLTAGGGCRITWAISPSDQRQTPTGFYVYLTPGLVASYVAPVATVDYVPGRLGYGCDLIGLSDSATYTVAVRSYNAVGCETNTSVWINVVGDSTPPADVELLIASNF